MMARILLVDDDPAVLLFVAIVLVRDGFSVAKAASAEEAISCIARDDFDLVITDFRMPGKSGDAVVTSIRERRREAKVIIISGYPNEIPEWLRSDTAGVRILAKPFSVSELRKAVGAAIGDGNKGWTADAMRAAS